jgi:hypothetical protein
MRFLKIGAVAGLAIAAAACNQGDSGNVMSPEANALEPADVNAALGPDMNSMTDANMMSANDMNAVDNSADTNTMGEPDANNATE